MDISHDGYLRVQVRVDWFLLQVLIGPEECLPGLRLAGAGIANDKDRVPHEEDFLQLDNLHDEVFLRLQLQVACGVLHGFLKLLVPLPRHVQVREEVGNKSEEDGGVVGHDLGDVEVPESTHEDLLLGTLPVPPLEHAGHHEDRLDGPQAPVVVVLLGEKLIAELVEGDKLAGERAGRRMVD